MSGPDVHTHSHSARADTSHLLLPSWWLRLFLAFETATALSVCLEASLSHYLFTGGSVIVSPAMFLGIRDGWMIAIGPVCLRSQFLPEQSFADSLPKGWDPATDNLGSSLRVRLVGPPLAAGYASILLTYILVIPYLRRLPPKHAKPLITRILLANMLLDVNLPIASSRIRPPRDLLLHPALWTQTIWGRFIIQTLAVGVKALWFLAVDKTRAHTVKAD
ncbi:hypothetical protein EHS25_000703 [Saitozyma podzolica]|uniref:Uncharacterized protein n=1 Tax=Saitozyma podzolica TaxID=1890683 RepID=A0A427YX21_9TREE|nr:hypothetical protein EHS25_000703 [Saitozyma podzolica]